MKIFVDSMIRIKLKDLSKSQIRKIKLKATTPNSEYEDAINFGRWISPDIPEAFLSYEEDDGWLVLHRGLLDEIVPILGKCKVIYGTSLFESLGLESQGDILPRGYQEEAVSTLLESNCGILVAPTGSGKTNMMIDLILKLDQPTIILVHRGFLVNQWKKRIKAILGYDCGIIGMGKIRIKNITIATIQTIQTLPKKTKKQIKERFGLLIADECHHTPASTWQYAVSFFECHYKFGCSATPVRKDRLQKILFDTIGPIRYIVSDRLITQSGDILPVEVRVVRLSNLFGAARTRPQYTKAVQTLIKNQDRSLKIVQTIASEVGEDRRHLVLSDRIIHLKVMEHLMANHFPWISTSVVYGSTPNDKREEIFKAVTSGEVQVMFASSIADEGLDIPALTDLHLTFPSRNSGRTKQQIGRVRRPYPGKKIGIVWDYWDATHKTFNNQYIDRRKFYAAEGYRIRVSGGVRQIMKESAKEEE